jgi:molybdenum cofactor cytidylyltransferase
MRDAGRGQQIAAVVLAAGFARRAAGVDKLLVPVAGKPIIRHVVDAVCEAGLDPVVVVIRPDASHIREALGDAPVTFVENPNAGGGLSTSLRCGIEALPQACAGAAILLGDMPWVRTSTLRALTAALDHAADRSICVPVFDGTRGNPVVWSARFFPEIATLTGDAGARGLLARYPAAVHDVMVDDAGVLRDVDTAEQIEQARNGV